MAQIQHVLFNLCAEIRPFSVGQRHESSVCQNPERAVKQYSWVLRSRGRPISRQGKGTDVPEELFLIPFFSPRTCDLAIEAAPVFNLSALRSVQDVSG